MRVFITGATGLVGTRLVKQLLIRKEEVVVVSRRPEAAKKKFGSQVHVVEGLPQQEGDWMKEIDGCQAIIHLAGEPILCRWSEVEKTELRNSRVFSTWNLVKAIEQAKERPQVLTSTSAIGYYGFHPEGDLDETSPPGDDFLAKLCVDWEKAALDAEKLGVRVAIIRTGVVLAKEGGALKQMLLPFRLGLGGPAGSGKQWMSWIHIDDLVDFYVKSLDLPRMKGPINGTAPEPVRNKEFSQKLASSLHRPCIFPVPAFALKLMYGEASRLVLEGQRVLPKAIRTLGLQYQYRSLDAALENLVGTPADEEAT